jgi:nucleotide-binding universal stress UspA family protein
MPDPGAILQQTAHEILDGVMAEVAAETEGLTVTSHVELGPAAQVLIDASTKADLLVVGRRGHGGFLGLVLGSVAQQVSGHASCAVVIIPTAE